LRDIVWTVIIIWIVWKIFDAFKNTSKSKTQDGNRNQTNFQNQKEGEVKINHTTNQKTQYNPSDAEYVEYEEIK
jgi:hypothetical protein